MKKFLLVLVLIFFTGTAFADDVGNLPADSALQRLKLGNERFVKMILKHPNTTKERREQLSTFQHQFVVILSCSDSRIPPELIFDQGLGDIFVIRNTGNVFDEHVLGSIEYAVEHLGVNLIVVMGHESCGAVAASMSPEKSTPAIESIKKAIEPAICECKQDNKLTSQDVAKVHAKQVAESISEDKDLYAAIKKRGIKIIPAYYNLTTGKVDFLN